MCKHCWLAARTDLITQLLALFICICDRPFPACCMGLVLKMMSRFLLMHLRKSIEAPNRATIEVSLTFWPPQLGISLVRTILCQPQVETTFTHYSHSRQSCLVLGKLRAVVLWKHNLPFDSFVETVSPGCDVDRVTNFSGAIL
ncbi:hypothetical protein BDV38DRAFT_113113 [Aspergillus pseudotamarii]|uniref:Secreted protein n=1 Tax=Aspergillus pseudotamarii TaxID=132259 RepID=A0A5N6SR16_ASPPS|nr:uncharacterized protein BDV38DRAFT_113113 [Aspergillus pseudotamarii]KAE8136259.1 hypothetical protein BDV38DRAFT_113113 [Aspergillus pseudotamarii]